MQQPYTRLILGTVTAFFLNTLSIQAFAPINFIAPDDSLVRSLSSRPLHEHRTARWLLEALLEGGHSRKSKNGDGTTTNLLQIHNATQSLLAAFVNPVTTSTQNFINNNTTLRMIRDQLIAADGKRGELVFTGRFSGMQVLLHARHEQAFPNIPGRFTFSALLPIKSLTIKDLAIVPRDDSGILVDDIRVKQLYTPLSKLFTLVSNASNGLVIDNWRTTSAGDLVLVIGWTEQAPVESVQQIDTILFFIETGLSVPTAHHQDIDHALALPFGNDGAVAIPFRIGFDINFALPIRIGASADLLFPLHTTKVRRLTTFPSQTEFLLLNKDRVRKKPGLTFRFNIFTQIAELIGDIALRVAYQYEQHTTDRLSSPASSAVSTGNNLPGWHHHNLFFEATVPLKPFKDRVDYIPELAFFYKLGLGGKRVIDMSTIGGRISVLF